MNREIRLYAEYELVGQNPNSNNNIALWVISGAPAE
jgi:hypothetical protein